MSVIDKSSLLKIIHPFNSSHPLLTFLIGSSEYNYLHLVSNFLKISGTDSKNIVFIITISVETYHGTSLQVRDLLSPQVGDIASLQVRDVASLQV